MEAEKCMNDVTYNGVIRELIISNLDGWQVTDIPPEPDPEVEVGGEDNVPVDPVETETETETGTETETINDATLTSDVEPFMTSTEMSNKSNKKITDNECRLFYEETLDQAYMHTNRLNIDDLTSVEARMFIRGVCKWTASNLWNKYNIRVNNEDMEDTYVQSYGGLLYKSALKILQPFINQRITSSSSISKDTESDRDVWII